LVERRGRSDLITLAENEGSIPSAPIASDVYLSYPKWRSLNKTNTAELAGIILEEEAIIMAVDEILTANTLKEGLHFLRLFRDPDVLRGMMAWSTASKREYEYNAHILDETIAKFAEALGETDDVVTDKT
jgi:hypothetical protein